MVGEVRGGEAADLLQALNTGHGGSLTTVHANNALSRIASCALLVGGELPWEVTCRGVVDGIAMVIHMTRRVVGRKDFLGREWFVRTQVHLVLGRRATPPLPWWPQGFLALLHE